MLSAIKFGDQYIPILDTYECPNGPAGTLPYQLPNNEKPTYNGSARDYYEDTFKAAFLTRDGIVYTDGSTSPPTHGAVEHLHLHGGNTDLHNGASFYLENPVIDSGSATYPLPGHNWQGRWMTGTDTDYTFNNTYTTSSIPNWPSSGRSYERWNKLFAIRIKYTSNPGYYNYIFGSMEKRVERTPTAINTQYSFSLTAAMNMNYWRRNDIEAYFEEEEMPDDEDPTDEGEPSDEDGGDGDHIRIYDPIPLPTKPIMGAANAGFVTMYKLTTSQINQFSSDMFASSVWEAIKLFFSNPIDFLVGCMLLPFDPPTTGVYYPKFGAVKFEHSYPSIGDQYFDVDCGSIHVKEYWGSCFDYEPYTKMQIWLPYIGYKDLAVDEFMNQTISVKYRIDCLTGDCTAFVYTGVVGETGPQVERVIGQYYGNCGVRVPFGSVSFDAAVAAGITLIGSAASAGLSAGAGAIAGGKSLSAGLNVGMKAAGADMLANDNASIGVVQGMKPNVHRGGAAGASHGYMAVQKPYLIKRIPRQNLPTNYMQLKGYPSNIGGTLSQFSGLAVVDDIQLNNIPAMEDERAEIIQWLKGGVII